RLIGAEAGQVRIGIVVSVLGAVRAVCETGCRIHECPVEPHVRPLAAFRDRRFGQGEVRRVAVGRAACAAAGCGGRASTLHTHMRMWRGVGLRAERRNGAGRQGYVRRSWFPHSIDSRTVTLRCVDDPTVASFYDRRALGQMWITVFERASQPFAKCLWLTTAVVIDRHPLVTVSSDDAPQPRARARARHGPRKSAEVKTTTRTAEAV